MSTPPNWMLRAHEFDLWFGVRLACADPSVRPANKNIGPEIEQACFYPSAGADGKKT